MAGRAPPGREDGARRQGRRRRGGARADRQPSARLGQVWRGGGLHPLALASAKARKASTIIKDITRTNAAFGAAEAAWKKLDEHSQPADFKALAEALKELARANYQAYYDQPVEHDAWEAGDAVFEAFHKALKAAAAPAK